MSYLWTFLAGFFTCAGLGLWFVLWAVQTSPNTYNDDRKYKANDDL